MSGFWLRGTTRSRVEAPLVYAFVPALFMHMRMAPACPLFREPVQCSRCEAWVASPSVSAVAGPLWFAVQSVVGVCLSACSAAVRVACRWPIYGYGGAKKSTADNKDMIPGYRWILLDTADTGDTAGYRGIPFWGKKGVPDIRDIGDIGDISDISDILLDNSANVRSLFLSYHIR